MPSPIPEADQAQYRMRSKSPSHKENTMRNRSRSPRQSPPPRRVKNYSGLKWKNNDRPRDEHRDRDRDRDGRTHGRGFRDDRGSANGRWEARDDGRQRDPDSRREERHGHRAREHPRDREHRHPHVDRKDRDREKKSVATPSANVGTGEAMIMVTVNDRLGTKAQIPCLASDPVKLFKAMVAAKIGRPVHEIMLKRQGQRPFHDSLTLADYEISNGVQIDLELNTGD